MMGLGIAALLGFVSTLLGYGLFVPDDLKSFCLVAGAASMAGYGLGSQSKKLTSFWRAFLTVVLAVACAACVVAYTLFVQRGTGEQFEVVRLASLLFGVFFSFSFLMPVVGVSIGQK
jgi:uncharacterized membrane protein AbrB (regulator of aidB expression)